MEQKTVFLSYRRDKSKHLARSIYQDLKMHGWDVFLDVTTIDSGDFDRIILNQIGARAHFILLISPGSLERCANAGDWVLREIEEAVRLDRNFVPMIEEGADFAHETNYLPDDLREVVSRKSGIPLTHFYFEAAMDALRNRFLKTPEYIQIAETPESERAEVKRRMEMVDETTSPSSIEIMPAPFAWIDIPDMGYSIAKYPITNAQFAVFMQAGGYNEQHWWTDAGWKSRQTGGQSDHFLGKIMNWSDESWTEPRYWQNKKWNGAEQPVAGVSWYEAVAFCLWLSDVTGEKIMLPTENQWQYAAQGGDDRAYPWGNVWDCTFCNNSVKPCDSHVATPVTRYEGKVKGDSPFGVTDMAGNVREWCLTDHDKETNNMNDDAIFRVLRGGSWNFDNTVNFKCNYRDLHIPSQRDIDIGFRVSRS
jgi:formylglycine-generating enzyme required for sulfatase activity